MKIGLCLSGGGVRSAAHIGVIKALLENGVEISAISGTSGGSIVAALYAVGYTVDEMEDIFKSCAKILWSDSSKIGYILQAAINIFRNPFGIVSARKFEKMMCKIFARVGASGMSTVKVPLAIPSVDINSSQIVMFVSQKELLGNCDNNCVYYTDTPICKAVRASCSLPIVFRPEQISGHTLVDGGLKLNIPVFPLRSFGCKRVITSDLSCSSCDEGCADSLLKIANQSLNILTTQLSYLQSKQSDYNNKIDLCDVGLLDLDRVSVCIEKGYDIAKKNMADIISSLYF